MNKKFIKLYSIRTETCTPRHSVSVINKSPQPHAHLAAPRLFPSAPIPPLAFLHGVFPTHTSPTFTGFLIP